MKTCRACGETLPLDSFYEVRRGDKTWPRPECKKCHNANTIRRGRARRYGLTVEELDALLEVGICAVCGVAVSGRDAHIDHDHKTGAFRDLTCQGCNLTIGHAREDIEVLKSAIKYLRKHRAR